MLLQKSWCFCCKAEVGEDYIVVIFAGGVARITVCMPCWDKGGHDLN